MATARPELATIENVLNFYDLQGDERPRFIIYAGHKIAPENCRFEYMGEDKNNGAAELLANLEAIRSNPANTNVYILQVLAEPAKNKAKNPNNSRSVTFQLNNPMPPGFPAPLPYQQQPADNSAMRAEIAALHAKIDSLMNDDDDDDDDEQPAGIMGVVNGLINQPEVQQMILAGIAKIFAPQGANGAQISGFANLTGNDAASPEVFVITPQMAQSLQTIADVVPDLSNVLEKLAAMAESNPAQLQMLVKMM